MRDPTWCFVFVLSVAGLSLAQNEPRIVSSAETVSVYSGETAYLKCRVTNLGTKLVKWTLMMHSILIYEGDQLLYGDAKKYSLKNASDGQSHNLQISNVGRFDQGFYQCAIDGTQQQIISHLNVIDLPKVTTPQVQDLNVTNCCLAENVPTACLPICYPPQIDLNESNGAATCGDPVIVKGLSKCFSGGSNHDNCCLAEKVDIICLGICHNDIPTNFTAEFVTKCFTNEAVSVIYGCFQKGFELLPSEPTDVTAMAFYAGVAACILVKWSEPKKNPHRVTGYLVMYKERNQTSYRSILIKDVTTRTYQLVDDKVPIQGDRDYKIRISAVADTGVSYGSVEVDIYFPPPAVINQLNGDIDTCCSNRSVDEKCRRLICDSRTWSQFNTDNVLACFPYLNDVFACLVGERNHEHCCAAYAVTNDCLPLCSGHPPPLNDSLIGCVSQMGIIESCVQQGYTTQPAPPTEVTITMVGTTSATIEFKPSTSSGLLDYLVQLRRGDENAQFGVLMTIGISEHAVQLSELSPNTYYWLRIISEGEEEDSLPSETVAFLTYPEGYDITKPKVTNVLHNMTDCCINSGMPEVCWKGCEYRSNITSYYSKVLAECYPHIASVLSCAADGRDHSQCCRSRGVLDICVELCSYTTQGSLDPNLVVCVPDTPKAIACFQEGIVNLPRHPDVVVYNVSKTSISLKWEQPKTSGLIDLYIINYGIVHSEKTSVSTNKTFYILQDLQHSTQYEISVTSSNSNGTSAPSPLITQYTLSGDSSTPPTINRTDISGRALWQNISHCCESNFQDVCLKQCLKEQTAHSQQTSCINESHKMMACFADGQDHRLCCEEKNLPSVCLPICAGHALTTEIAMATCMSYDSRQTILDCYLEDKELLPDAPTNFGARLTGTNGSVRLQWSPAGNCKTDCTYSVHYWRSGIGSTVLSLNNIINTFKILRVIPNSIYTFTVTAENYYGSSSPSAWQTLYITNYEREVNLYLDSNYKWVENGQSANLICEKYGFDPDGSYTVEWFFNNRRKLNNDKLSLVIPNVNPAIDEGSYTCSVIDSDITSSDSLFLSIKYAPKFSHFFGENAQPGVGQNARIDCLFQGLPDSDAANKWLKNGQAITKDTGRYIMTRIPDFETGLTTYRIHIDDVVESDYGTYSLKVSNAYGTAECQMNLTNPANIHVESSPNKPDLRQCCVQNNISSFCLELCGFHVNTSEVIKDPRFIPCLQYFRIYFMCGAESNGKLLTYNAKRITIQPLRLESDKQRSEKDGRDHTKCCQKEGVLPMCIPLCKGEIPAEAETAFHLIPCIPDQGPIFTCAQQGHMQLPYPPESITLTYKSQDGTILVRWKPHPLTADKVDHYNIYYNYTGSPVPTGVSVSEFVTEYNIRNVQARKVYNVWMTAGNVNGSSLASSIQKIDTSTDSVAASSGSPNSSDVGLGVGIAVGVLVLIAIIVVIAVFAHRSKMCPATGNSSVTFENQSYGNRPDHIKIQGADEHYGYGRLQEDNSSEARAAQDSSSSAAASSFENPAYKLQHGSTGAATLPVDSDS